MQTLDLLYRMTNPVNVEVIVDKQLFYLRTTTDVFLRTDLVSRVTQAAEKYAPNNSWCVSHRATPHHMVARPRVLRPSFAHFKAQGMGVDVIVRLAR